MPQRLDQGGQQRTRVDFALGGEMQAFAEAAFQFGFQLAQLVAPQPAQMCFKAGVFDALGQMLHSGLILAMRHHQRSCATHMYRPRQRWSHLPPQPKRSGAPTGDFGFRFAQFAVRRQHPRADMTAMVVETFVAAFEKTNLMSLPL
ncbi:MAG: hypothetical protein U1F42_04285 [Candidatus Competibacteraceae bacterium]